MDKSCDLVWEVLPCKCEVKETIINGERHYDLNRCPCHQMAPAMLKFLVNLEINPDLLNDPHHYDRLDVLLRRAGA